MVAPKLKYVCIYILAGVPKFHHCRSDCSFAFGFCVSSCAKDITLLWRDEAIKEAYNERHKYWLLDAAAYYFDNVGRCATKTEKQRGRNMEH